MKLQNKPTIRYLGENGFRRSEKDVWINLLYVFKNGANPKDKNVLELLQKLNVFTKTKNINNGINRITTLFQRMGLLVKKNDKLYSSSMAIQDIIDQKNDSNIFSSIEWGFFKSLIILSEKIYTKHQKQNEKHFLLDFLSVLKENNYIAMPFEETFLNLQNNEWDPEAVNFSDFANAMIYNLNNKTDKDKTNRKNKKAFWQKYYNVYYFASIGNKQYEKEYIDLFWMYKNVKIYPWKRTKKFEELLSGFDEVILGKKTPLQKEILKYFNFDNFSWVVDENIINFNIKKYFSLYSLKDNIDITKRALLTTTIFSFYKQNKKLYVVIPSQYIEFCDKLIEKYNMVTNIIVNNPSVEFQNVNAHLKLKPSAIVWDTIYDIIDKITINKINKILYDIDKPKKLKVHFDDIKTLEFNSVTSPTWLEYFTMLKIITLFPTLDEKIWNGSLDRQLKPLSFASGGKSDIYFEKNNKKTIVEVTLTKGDNQTKMEVTSIGKHMYQYNADICLFIAPEISENTKIQLNVGYKPSNANLFLTKNKIKYFTTQEFSQINTLENI